MNHLYIVSMRICVPVFRKKKKINLTLYYFVTFTGYIPPHDTASLVVTQAGGGAAAPSWAGRPGAVRSVHGEWARNVLLMVKTLCTIYTFRLHYTLTLMTRYCTHPNLPPEDTALRPSPDRRAALTRGGKICLTWGVSGIPRARRQRGSFERRAD